MFAAADRITMIQMESGLVRRGSLRKVLPSIPDPQHHRGLLGQTDLGSVPLSAATYTSPFFSEYALLAEYNLLQRQRVPGVFVIPAAKSPLVWFGVMFIRQGYYEEGVFRFSVIIPELFPDAECPRVVFDEPVFHPLINATSAEMDVRRAFQRWSRSSHHICHLLLFLRKSFHRIDTSQPANPEAALMYDRARDMFTARAADAVRRSKQTVFDPPSHDDPHAIVFAPYRPELHEHVRHAMLHPQREEVAAPTSSGEHRITGYSWVKPGSLQPFSKPDSL